MSEHDELDIAFLGIFDGVKEPPVVVYIAGPYRQNPEVGRTVLENVRLAERVAIACARAGVLFFCPHLNSAHQSGVAPARFYLDLDLEILRRACDVVVLLPGWQHSSGTLGEIKLAKELRKPIYELTGLNGVAA